MDSKVQEVVGRALEGTPPTYDEVIMLLELEEASPEATAVRNAANDMVRARTGNAGALLGQIGIDVYPCEADC